MLDPFVSGRHGISGKQRITDVINHKGFMTRKKKKKKFLKTEIKKPVVRDVPSIDGDMDEIYRG